MPTAFKEPEKEMISGRLKGVKISKAYDAHAQNQARVAKAFVNTLAKMIQVAKPPKTSELGKLLG